MKYMTCTRVSKISLYEKKKKIIIHLRIWTLYFFLLYAVQYDDISIPFITSSLRCILN